MTRNHHVGFLFPQSGIGKHNKMSWNFKFSSYHNTKLQLRDKNIRHKLWWNLKSCHGSKSKIAACFFMFFSRKSKFLGISLYRAIQKGNQGAGQNRAHKSAYRVTQTLYIKGLHDAVRTFLRKILPRSLVSCLYCTV